MPPHTVTITFDNPEDARQLQRHLRVSHRLKSEIREEPETFDLKFIMSNECYQAEHNKCKHEGCNCICHTEK